MPIYFWVINPILTNAISKERPEGTSKVCTWTLDMTCLEFKDQKSKITVTMTSQTHFVGRNSIIRIRIFY